MRPLVVDRKWLFAVMLIICTVVLVVPLPLPVLISPDVQGVYDVVDAIPAGSIVYVDVVTEFAMWYDGSGFPPFVALVNHLHDNHLKVIYVSMQYAQAAPFMERILDPNQGLVKRAAELVNGEDYVILPVVLGGEPGMIAWFNDIVSITPYDIYNTPVGDIPMMQGVTTAADFDFAVTYGYGVTLIEQEIRQLTAQYYTPTLIVVPDSFAPGLRTYVQSGQVVGMLHGARKGAEYELLVGKAGQGLSSMGQYTLGVLLFVGFVVAASITSPTKKLTGAEM
jgi:hypothetical protein